MKLLLENWRKYMNEEVKFSGILKLMPEPQVVSQAKSFIEDLPDEAQYLGDDRLHITLAHQSVLKPFRKQLKAMAKAGELPQEPVIVSEDLEDMWEVRPAFSKIISWLIVNNNSNVLCVIICFYIFNKVTFHYLSSFSGIEHQAPIIQYRSIITQNQ